MLPIRSSNKILSVFLIFILFVCSCKQENRYEKWKHIEIFPKDKSQVITIITTDDKRYIMNGKHNKIPDDNYLLLDLSKVDPLGDGFSICWDENGYNWKIASTYAKLIENKLDTSKYSYYQPLNKQDKPISLEYKKTNCGNFLIRENRNPWGNLIVEYIEK